MNGWKQMAHRQTDRHTDRQTHTHRHCHTPPSNAIALLPCSPWRERLCPQTFRRRRGRAPVQPVPITADEMRGGGRGDKGELAGVCAFKMMHATGCSILCLRLTNKKQNKHKQAQTHRHTDTQTHTDTHIHCAPLGAARRFALREQWCAWLRQCRPQGSWSGHPAPQTATQTCPSQSRSSDRCRATRKSQSNESQVLVRLGKDCNHKKCMCVHVRACVCMCMHVFVHKRARKVAQHTSSKFMVCIAWSRPLTTEPICFDI